MINTYHEAIISWFEWYYFRKLAYSWPTTEAKGTPHPSHCDKAAAP